MGRRDERYTYTTGIPATRLGELLGGSRIKAGFDEKRLAQTLNTSVRRLRRWEAGNEIPSDEEIERFAFACGVAAGDLFPERDRVEYDPQTYLMRVGETIVALPSPDNQAILDTYLRLVRLQRNLPLEAYVHIRKTDIDLLANTLDLHDEHLEERLVVMVGMSPQAAAELRYTLVRRRHPSSGYRA